MSNQHSEKLGGPVTLFCSDLVLHEKSQQLYSYQAYFVEFVDVDYCIAAKTFGYRYNFNVQWRRKQKPPGKQELRFTFLSLFYLTNNIRHETATQSTR